MGLVDSWTELGRIQKAGTLLGVGLIGVSAYNFAAAYRFYGTDPDVWIDQQQQRWASDLCALLNAPTRPRQEGQGQGAPEDPARQAEAARGAR